MWIGARWPPALILSLLLICPCPHHCFIVIDGIFIVIYDVVFIIDTIAIKNLSLGINAVFDVAIIPFTMVLIIIVGNVVIALLKCSSLKPFL
jgi:hypothetical protein